MRTLRDVMDDAAGERDALTRAALYSELAPVYEFERKQMRDHDEIADYVVANAPAEASSVAVGACGPGFVLAGLAGRFEEAVGIDLSRQMLELATSRTDAQLVVADVGRFVAPERFDAVTLLGGTIAHAPTAQQTERRDENDTPIDGVHTLFANAYKNLTPGGVFICDFMERGALRSGDVSVTTFESERFHVNYPTLLAHG